MLENLKKIAFNLYPKGISQDSNYYKNSKEYNNLLNALEKKTHYHQLGKYLRAILNLKFYLQIFSFMI